MRSTDPRKRRNGKWLDQKDLKVKEKSARRAIEGEAEFRLGHIAWTWAFFGNGELVLE